MRYSIRVDKEKAVAMKAAGWRLLGYGGDSAMMGTEDLDMFEAARQNIDSDPEPEPEPKPKKKAKKERKA